MSNLAKDAVLRSSRSHYIHDNRHSHAAEGIAKEEVFLYFSAKWRSQPVIVTMQAARYAASFFDSATDTSTNRLTEWRTYASEARFEDPERNGGRGEHVTGTARSALGKLCEPLVTDWLASDAYKASFQAAVARMIMRKFHDEYSATRDVSNALAVFESRLSPTVFQAISETLDARNAYEDAKARAHEAIDAQVAR